MPIIAIDEQLQGTQGTQGTLFGALNRCRIESEAGALCVFSPYSPGFVADLKFRIPGHLRSWSPPKRAWIVDASQGQTLLDLIKDHFGETLQLPVWTAPAFEPVAGTFEIEYIGRCKQRGEENLAFGLANNVWSFVFSEQVLRAWFERSDGSSDPAEKEPDAKQLRPKTFYQILRVKQADTAADIKKGYYRLARQWHPDICREEDARERFEQIKAAYDILSNPQKRKRYDLGLKLQKSAMQTIKAPARRDAGFQSRFGYSPDLRCGRITLTGRRSLGKTIVENILGWDDIENERGEFLVSSWNFDQQQIEKIWISRNVIF